MPLRRNCISTEGTMKTRRKEKQPSLLMAFALMVGLFPTAAFAEGRALTGTDGAESNESSFWRKNTGTKKLEIACRLLM